jgi:DNA-binding MarR family transcriptional regulator
MASDSPASAPRADLVRGSVVAVIGITSSGVACVRTHTLSSDTEMSNHDELFQLIGVLARKRHRAAERGYAALGLNHTEARLLTILAGEGGTSTQEALSRQMTVDRSNAGRAFKRLEQEGHVTRRRSDSDARTNFVDITERGREAAAEVARLRDALAATFFGDLTEAEAAKVVKLLRMAL